MPNEPIWLYPSRYRRLSTASVARLLATYLGSVSVAAPAPRLAAASALAAAQNEICCPPAPNEGRHQPERVVQPVATRQEEWKPWPSPSSWQQNSGHPRSRLLAIAAKGGQAKFAGNTCLS